jgi:hypothetical protein
MSTAGSTCPENENSTDCLLRALLKALDDQAKAEDAKFDWDPVTFGFTVSIGIIAAVFALVTILQAVLAAGPGRRKSNSNAIGEWAQYTTRKWSWADMTMLSIARTPVLRVSRITFFQLTPPKKSHPQPELQPPRVDVAATWWAFLKEAGMPPPNPDWDLQTTLCDYLPDDLQAAPAYAEVGCIVAMAAVAGALSFKPDPQSAYPIIVGPGFQFDFRQHPTLGTVGAFSRYGASKKPRRWTRLMNERVYSAIHHSYGVLTSFSFMGHYAFRKLGALDTDDVDARQTHPGRTVEKLHERPELNCDPAKALCRCKSLYRRPDDHHLLWLLAGHVPNEPPAVFPSNLVMYSNVLSALALSSGFWRERKAVRLGEMQPSILSSEQIRWWPHPLPTWIDADLDYGLFLCIPPAERPERWIPKPSGGFGIDVKDLDSEKVVVFSPVFRACLRFLYCSEDFQAWFNALNDINREGFRILVLLQLRQVEKWLKRHKASTCRAVTLYLTTLALLDAEKSIADGSFFPSDTFDKPLSPWNKMPGDEQLASGFPADVTNRHFTTIRTLGQFLDHISLPGTSELTLNMDEVERFRTQLFCLTGRDPFFEMEPETGTMVSLLHNIRGIARSCFEVHTGDRHMKVFPEMKRPVVPLEPEVRRDHLEDYWIDDMLVWRCILMAIVFRTALDSSAVVASGLWNHVIPII